MAPPVITVISDIIIPAGQSLSNGVDCSAGYVQRIIMPALWTPANISFRIAAGATPTDQDYVDLVDSTGREVLCPVVAGSGVLMARAALIGNVVGWIKIRSGARDHPVLQQAERTFTIVLSEDPAVQSLPA